MKNAAALLTPQWVAQQKVESETLFKTWGSSEQKKWQIAYLQRCGQSSAMVLENGQETVTKLNALKAKVKTAIDGTEKIVEAQRKKSQHLSDAEHGFLEKAKAVVDGSAAEFAALTKAFSDNSPMAFRENFMDGAAAAGALTSEMVAKIKGARKPGIDISNEFGKQSPIVARMAEYRERWAILSSELSRLDKMRTAQGHEVHLQLTQQIKELKAGNEKWETDFANDIGKLVSNISSFFDGKIDKGDDKSFGASLMKNVKLMVSSKAKAKDKKAIADKQIQVKMKLDKWTTDIKGIKGALKTRLMAHESLTASLKTMGPQADPFRKILADVGKALATRQDEVDALMVQVSDAITELKK
jgi:hypothetical protein